MQTPKLSWAVIARAFIYAITIINQALVLLGIPPIPIEDAETQNWLSFTFLVIAGLIGWWFDNDITIKARIRKLLGKKALDQEQ